MQTTLLLLSVFALIIFKDSRPGTHQLRDRSRWSWRPSAATGPPDPRSRLALISVLRPAHLGAASSLCARQSTECSSYVLFQVRYVSWLELSAPRFIRWSSNAQNSEVRVLRYLKMIFQRQSGGSEIIRTDRAAV